jgi:hypothetical protein
MFHFAQSQIRTHRCQLLWSREAEAERGVWPKDTDYLVSGDICGSGWDLIVNPGVDAVIVANRRSITFNSRR